MIIAGDVGGTKCNLALFAESRGKLIPVFKERFASKDFAQFDLIVREFYRQAAPHVAAIPASRWSWKQAYCMPAIGRLDLSRRSR